MSPDDTTAQIRVSVDGPYLVTDDVEIVGADGQPVVTHGPVTHLCRCGGSRNAPLCDATHGLKSFDGTETPGPQDAGRTHDPAPSADRACVLAIADGPLELVGDIDVIGSDGSVHDTAGRRTLCRCGRSRTKPFCDDTHLQVGFRDPVPAGESREPPTLYEWAGGIEALERLTERFYGDLLSKPDPILEPVFRGMDPGHPRHVAAWLGETFGGPPAFTVEHGGYEHMVSKHRGLALTDVQRRRWVERMCATADLVGLPADPDFRANFVGYLEWGTRIAVFNSAPGATVIEHAPVPQWGWGQSPPYTPQPWETGTLD